MSSLIIGIDLGTTNSCFGYVNEGRVELIEDDSDGQYLIPSVLVFDNDGQILVGQNAVGMAHMYKLETIYEAKRLIGQSFDDPKVQEDVRRFPYVIKNDFGVPKIVIKNNVWDRELYVEEISQHILKYIINIAEKRLQVSVTEAVITVPAYFGNEQRTATKDAATLAGIQTAHIINEPTAAALAFQFNTKNKAGRHLLIYDFGGGTFDVCIVYTRGTHCKVLAVDGDCHLGGTDVDVNIVNFIKSDFKARYQKEINETDYRICRRLKNLAEAAKKYLTNSFKYRFEFISILPGTDYNVDISRQEFEKLNKDLFQRTIDISERCVVAAGLAKDQIDEVILVGGSSRIPKVKEMLKATFGSKINDSKNPDQMVAYGAAVYASTLSGDKKLMTFSDVLTLSLGTDVRGNRMNNIVNRNTALPCENSKIYITTYDNQTEMSVKIYQGERILASENCLLGDMCISNLTEAPAGNVRVEVKFSVNAEGILLVTAQELNTNNLKSLDIDMRNSRMSKNDIQEKIKEAEDARKADEALVLLANKKIEFKESCTALEDRADTLEGQESDNILREIESSKRTVKGFNCDQIDEIDVILERLTRLFDSAPT